MYRVLLTLFILSLSQSYLNAQFHNITSRAGLWHTCASEAILGGGAAFIDYDGDGWLDIAMTGGEEPDKLYRNNSDGTFTDVSELLSKHNQDQITSAVVAGDLNGDGCPDLLFNTYNRFSDIILRNNCDGSFTLIPAQALPRVGSSVGSTLFDFNKDGLLDIYVTNYVAEPSFIYNDEEEVIGFDHSAEHDYLYINFGGFQFSEQSRALGINSQGCGLAATVIPTPDHSSYGILVANDFGEWVHPNEFFVLQPDGTFQDEAAQYGLDIGIYSMGIAVGDYDEDADFDLMISNLGKNALLKYDSSTYTRVEEQYGVANTLALDGKLATSWGTFFCDVNNDTRLDLFVANGFINSPEFIKAGLIDPNQLYLNNGSDRFVEVADSYGLTDRGFNRGAVYGDIDNDGDLDILTAYINYENTVRPDIQYKLYENISPESNYLDIDLAATTTAGDAFGTIVEAYHSGKKFLQYKYSSGTHASQSSPYIHYGLGDAMVLDSLIIKWPSGTEERHYTIPANEIIQVVEGISTFEILGCTDSNATNYNPNATLDYGCLLSGDVSTSDLNNDDCFAEQFTISGNILIIEPQSTSRIRISLFDLDGRIIGEKEISAAHRMYDLRELAASSEGIYILKLSSLDCSYSKALFVGN